MELSEYLDPLAAEIAFWILGLQNPEYPIDQLGSLSESMSEKLRTIAIITLLVEADTDLFYHNLIRSGVVREIYLQRCISEGYEDYHLAISRSGAFFDALAAGDFELAIRISSISQTRWIPEGEYEDDYSFMQFFHYVLQPDLPRTTLIDLLNRFESSLEGIRNAKLDVCHALASQDQESFEEGFHGLIEEYDAHLMEERERGQMEDPHVIAERQIFVEGLAILRVAERLGFRTEAEYRYCPVLARLPMTIPLADPFPEE